MSDIPGSPKVSRKLAAILAADIAGYALTRVTRNLKAHQAVSLPMVAKYGGSIIDTSDDGLLAEFRRVLGAVRCVLAMQEKMVERNAPIKTGRRMQFRIGINQGSARIAAVTT